MIVNINGKPFPITSHFNEVDSVHSLPHMGIDLAMPTGTELFSPVEGIIQNIINNNQLGKAIVMKLENGKELILAHLSKISVKKGEIITVGEKLGESGNTGHSTGAHLHIGLKDNGQFIDPTKYEEMLQNTSISDVDNTKGGFFSGIKEFNENIHGIKDFFHDMKHDGLWYAITGEHFDTWLGGLFKRMFMFTLENNDLFIIAPAILFMFITFFIGKNKFTRWIIPLWFFYFVTEILYAQLLAIGW